MVEQLPQVPPEDLTSAQALAGWSALAFAVDHLLVRDLLHAQHILDEARAALHGKR